MRRRAKRPTSDIVQLPINGPEMIIGRGERRSDCHRYNDCLTAFVRKHLPIERDEVPGKCPKACGFYEQPPSHVRVGMATTRTESQWSMTAMPKCGWSRKGDDDDDE